jgi:predicted kinase
MESNQQPANHQPQIILITGNMAAGKSSVAQSLAERLPKSVHLRGDIFRRTIVNGQAQMALNLSAEAYQQLQLRYHLAAMAARHYLQAGFTVVYQKIWSKTPSERGRLLVLYFSQIFVVFSL